MIDDGKRKFGHRNMFRDNKEAKFKGCKTKIMVVRAVWWEEARNIQSPLNPINYSCSFAKSVTGFFIFFSSFLLLPWATSNNILKVNTMLLPHLAIKVVMLLLLQVAVTISPRKFIYPLRLFHISTFLKMEADFVLHHVLCYSPPPQTVVVQQPHQQNSAADDCCCAW